MTCKYFYQISEKTQFYQKKIPILFQLYVIWGFVNFSLEFFGEKWLTGINVSTLTLNFFLNYFLNFLVSIITGDILTLWYIYLLLIFYVIFPKIVKFLENKTPNQTLKYFLIFFTTISLLLVINHFLVPLPFFKEDFTIYTLNQNFFFIEVNLNIIAKSLTNFCYFSFGILISRYSVEKSFNINKLIKVIPIFSIPIYLLNGFLINWNGNNMLLFVLNFISMLNLYFLFIGKKSKPLKGKDQIKLN
jgi:hypothetical protein